jgi:ketosteroid isomerase-like protein
VRDLRHEFAGDHALGRARTARRGFAEWLERRLRLFPVLTFEPCATLIEGPPRDLAVAVFWTDRGQTADGIDNRDHGVRDLTIRRGRLVSLSAHLDKLHLSQVLERMAKNGSVEASAPPIEDRP